MLYCKIYIYMYIFFILLGVFLLVILVTHKTHFFSKSPAGLIASLLLTTTAYGTGVGAVPYTIIGEIFTPEFRTLGSCMAQVVR